MSSSSSGVEPRDVHALHPLPALLALLHAGWIWWLSSAPRSIGGSGRFWNFVSDSTHLVLFGLLAVLLLETLRRGGGWTRNALLAVLALTVGWGVVDELHQGSVPHRHADPADVCTDFLGAVGAIALWWGVRGPGRIATAVGRASIVAGVALAFNAWRAFAPEASP